jgi:hypothetical protein
MNGSARQTGVRTARTHATPAVAPIARAIRTALAISAMGLSLSVPLAAFAAGTCGHDAAPNIFACDAALLLSPPDAAPVDLTRVDGNNHPSSVLAAAGPAMHDAWSMDTSAITVGHADALLVADGMSVDDVTVVDDGGLAFAAPVSLGFGPGDIAMLTEIDNSSDIHVSGYGGNVVGYSAFDDSVTIVNSGSITAEAAPFSAGGYAAAIGVRAAGYDVEVHNEAGGLIGATAISDGGQARARAVYATGYFDSVTVDNDGDIQAYARANGGNRAEAHGVYAFGYGSATAVQNAGDIEVSAQSDDGFGSATGITSIGYGQGDNAAVVANTGSIDAETNAAYAYAFGVLNLTRQRYGNGYFTNEGDIHAEANGNYATATGALNLTLRYGNSTTTNTGTIEAVANGTAGATATALYSYANIYDASVDNSGVASATGTGDIAIATGIQASSSLYGATSVVNSGDVAAHAYGSAGFAQAAGIVAESETVVDLANYGTIDVIARSVDDTAFAAGMYGSAVETTTLRNYGTVSALAESTYGDAIAYGAFEFAGYAGIGLMINGGEIDVESSAGAGAQAHATGINVIGDVASVFNDVSASATATAGDGGLADARAARAYGLYTAVSNYGALTANASADGGLAMARGADSLGTIGSYVYNAGDLQASATADGGQAFATGVYSVGVSASAYTINTGAISAQARGDSATAYGALNASAYYGDAITTNAGSISAVAEGGVAEYGEAEAIAFGVYNFALLYNSVVDNSGSISATASAMADISGTYGFLQAKAVGAEALNAYGYLDAVIANSGDISAAAMTSQGYASAWGAAVQSTGLYGGTSLIDNDGSISAYAYADIGVANATGAYALNQMADSQVVNHGDISAMARAERGIVNVSVNYAYAIGVKDASYYGTTDVDNYGNITAIASVYGGITGARGIQASGAYSSVSNAEGATITAIGEAELFGGGFATGIEASATYGIDVVNDGTVNVYGHAHAYGTHYGASRAMGIYANAGYQGDVSVVNNGDITAVALAEDSLSFFQGGAGAVGINAYAKYDATIVNAGDITAIADAEFGITGAYGTIVHGKYSSNLVNEGNIVATATAGSLYGDQYAGRAVSFGAQVFGNGMEQGLIDNAGSIASHATVTADGSNPNSGIAGAWGVAIGYNSGVQNGTVVNQGDIEAVASADFGYATAYGSLVDTQYGAATSNAGSILASATAVEGNAWAVGSHTYALHATRTYNCTYVNGPYGGYNVCDYSNPIINVDGGESVSENSGNIIAMASAEGGVGYSYGAVAVGGFSASLTNTGVISAITQADDALATGALVNAFYGDASLVNSGDILAAATGTIANATGVLARGLYGAQIDNAGQILAGAYGADATATAVQMGDSGSNVLTNTGTIAAFGDGTRIAVSSGSGATASIVNQGTLVGAIVTGDLDDSLENAAGAIWQAVGESNFGAGTNYIGNHGTILMDNAAIQMGADTAAAASFAAFAVPGVSAFENSGTVFAAGADNVIDTGGAFHNNGVISFIDGAPDDVLAIVGDFSGEGVINLDVSGLNQVSDQLYVDGSVIEPTTQTVNLNLVDLPTAPNMDIQLISASGTLAGDFVLGDLQYAGDGFVSMDFDLITAGNTVSLGVDVTGLNDAGSLAAAVAPGVQSLVNAQIGTWRQRVGVVPEWGKVGIAPWVRVFADSGDVDPAHSANFGAGGHYGFRQSNRGWELGIDARPSENVAVGLLIADVESSQHLSQGAGSDQLDGQTFGLYGTWMGNSGLYLDVSQRWTGIDARLHTATGSYTTKASANSFNIEAGFTAWTTMGINVVPQVQYTRTRISDIGGVRSSQADFVADGGMSSRGRLGLALDKTFQGAGFTWTPYGSINAVREFDGEYDHSINGGLLGTTSLEGTSAMVELGASARKDKLSVTGGVNWTDGGALQSVAGGQLVVRYSW